MQAKKLTLWSGVALLGLSSFSVQAAVIDLFEYGFNIDGTIYQLTKGDLLPAEIDLSGFDYSGNGLGNIDITITGAGTHNVDAFFDHEISEPKNTFFNEYGASTGLLAAGQSWEIDEPGFVFGDIFNNFKNSTLDNTNALPVGVEDDVSLAIGWDFILAAGESATINLTLSDTIIPSDFYLTHTDPYSIQNIYLSSSLICSYGPCQIPVPEPSILFLFGIGVAGLAFNRRRLAKD